MPVTYSVVLPYWLDRPPLEALDIARTAASCGYGELWVGEMMTFDAFALGAAILRETEGMRVTVGPLAIGLRTPAALALGTASLAQLGGRRAGLALGASTPVVVSSWHGRPWDPTVMPAAMRENVEVLRDLFAGNRVSRRGTHVTCDGFRLVAGAQDVTITVAAFAPSMLRLAARIADRVVINLSTPQQAARAKAAIVAAAAQAGRTPPPLAAWIPAAADASDATIAQLARQLVVYLAPPGYGEMFIDAGFGEIVDRARAGTHPRELLAAIPRELIDTVAAVGNEARVRDRIDEFVTAGVDEVAIVPVTAADEAGRRLLQTLVPR